MPVIEFHAPRPGPRRGLPARQRRRRPAPRGARCAAQPRNVAVRRAEPPATAARWAASTTGHIAAKGAARRWRRPSKPMKAAAHDGPPWLRAPARRGRQVASLPAPASVVHARQVRPGHIQAAGTAPPVASRILSARKDVPELSSSSRCPAEDSPATPSPVISSTFRSSQSLRSSNGGRLSGAKQDGPWTAAGRSYGGSRSGADSAAMAAVEPGPRARALDRPERRPGLAPTMAEKLGSSAQNSLTVGFSASAVVSGPAVRACPRESLRPSAVAMRRGPAPSWPLDQLFGPGRPVFPDRS